MQVTRWSDKLAFEVALNMEGSGDDIDDIRKHHKFDVVAFTEILQDPVFQKRVMAYRDDIVAKGLTFRLKARAQAEELLTTSYLLIHNPDVSPAVKADLIKSTVKWAGLEPKGDTPTTDGGGVKITINLGPTEQAPAMRVIEHDTID